LGFGALAQGKPLISGVGDDDDPSCIVPLLGGDIEVHPLVPLVPEVKTLNPPDLAVVLWLHFLLGGVALGLRTAGREVCCFGERLVAACGCGDAPLWLVEVICSLYPRAWVRGDRIPLFDINISVTV
jgi:hypothetical protein